MNKIYIIIAVILISILLAGFLYVSAQKDSEGMLVNKVGTNSITGR